YYNQSCGFCNKPVNFKKLTDAYRSGDNGSPYTDKESYYSVMYGCPNCEKQSLIVFGSIAVSGGRTFFYKTQFPKYSPIRMADVPEEIEKDRFEAWNCYFNGCFKSSAIMARAALQRAVRKLEAEGKGLYNEIENLKDKSVITKQLADFAHEVRITGNDFAHPDEISEVNQKEVEESLDFLDGFLEMVFVLPLVAERRKKARLESQK
ncbi:MAG TPA: DUF4145 domain-containing protein, partial [Patescibacteria group bacterium]|nr:DUF4145 domain-containing protein [Patescibacteria group bacterium]